MQMPSVVHPLKFRIAGFVFEVVSFFPLTDEQAAGIARREYHRCRKTLKKKDRDKVLRVLVLADEDLSGLL